LAGLIGRSSVVSNEYTAGVTVQMGLSDRDKKNLEKLFDRKYQESMMRASTNGGAGKENKGDIK
jgi:hypothetical protein